jgi:hypothetical protein
MLAGDVGGVTQAPFVTGKSTEAFGLSAELHDMINGWCCVDKPRRRTNV